MFLKTRFLTGMNKTAKARSFNTFLYLFTAFSLFFVNLSACTRKTENNTVVNLAIWGNYIAPETIREFSEKTGVKLNISNYSSNEELLAKIQAGATDIDVAVPSDYMVEIMIKDGLLAEIEADKLEHRQLIYPELLGQSFDSQNKYSYPYTWTSAGIAYNTKLLPKGIQDWKSFFEDPALKGKISMLDDVREVMAAALKLNGHSVNTTKAAELEQAKKSLSLIKSRIKMFRSDTVDALKNREILAAHSYSSDALIAAAESNGEIAFILPSEGATRAIDNLVILATSKNKEAAHKLLNFLLSPEVNSKFVQSIFGGPVLTTTKDSLPENLKTNTALFPSAEVLAKLEHIHDLGNATEVYDKIWTEIKID